MVDEAPHMRRNVLFAGLLIAGLLALNGCGGKDEAAAAGAGGPPGGMQLPVETVTVQPQALVAGLQTVGSLRADELVVVRPEVAGRISRIHFTEGGRVAAGQPLFTLDGSLAQASLNEATANLDNTRRAAARAGELSKEKLIAQSDYDKARASLGVDQARVSSARTVLSKMTLRAPFAGQIGLREVSVGEFVDVGQDLVTLVRLDPIEVDFSVPETVLAQLRNGQKLRVTIDAYPDDTFAGEVVAIDPVVDANSRSARLRAQIPNPDGRLKPGQFAKLQIDTGTDDAAALLVPEQALMQDGDTRFVYTVVDGKARKTVIRTGARVPGMVQVLEGLKGGAGVITAGQGKPMMHDGMAVMVLPPQGAAGPEGAGAATKPASADAAADKAAADKAEQAK
jgi:membrane fusion protein (multidrug efflux system)